jgi:hypothetical protein
MAHRNDNDGLPESAMGGSSDAGAHGVHPASAAKLGHPLPDEVLGDAAIERRHHHDPHYNGPERRIGPGEREP